MATVAMSRQPVLNRVSWGALFAGFFFGFATWMLLLALGAGIGFAAFDPRDLGSWQGLGIGFGIWGVVSGIVAMFLAAWVSVRLSEADSRPHGMLHGAALWGFMMVAGLWIATMAVTRTAGAAASAAGTAAQAAGQAASDPQLRREAQQQQAQVQQQAQDLKQRASENKEEAASAAKTAGTTGAWAFFLYGLLTLVAAMLGGRTGVPKERLLIGHEDRTTVPPGAPMHPQRA